MLPGILLSLASAPQAPTEQIDAYLKQEMETWRVPGASVAVVREGAVVFEKGYGLANLELGVRADENTVYELLSVSKQFTAAAVMLLVDEKKLSLDDPIVARLDGLPESWKDVTVSELLSHTSGIPDYTDQRGWFEMIRSARTPQDLLATVESKPLLFPPGTAWKYSNSNYYLLGLLIERLTGERFDTFVASHIFEPLAMHATRMESFEAILPHRAAGYHASKEAVSNSPWIDPSHKWAAGFSKKYSPWLQARKPRVS
jgi:CubicO group peptidase (beta-lactamase class C family)